MNPTEPSHTGEQPLESWKEIAAYLQREATTVQRWEKEEGLPVHRHSHKSRSSVYAYPSEIDAWRAGRKVVPEPLPLWRSLLAHPRSLAFGATMLLCLIMVGNGVRPQAASAQERQPSVRQVFSDGTLFATGAPSRDGRYLGLTDRSSGDLVIRDLVTRADHRFTGAQIGGAAVSNAISPDGHRIAYVSADLDRTYGLRVLPVNADPAASPRVLLRQPEYLQAHAWTPDGERIIITRAVADRTTQIAVVSVADGSVQPIKSLLWEYPEGVSLSPDGRYLAYDAAPGQGLPHDVFLLAADGSRETVAAEGPASDFRPLWSPDGSHLVFLSTRTGSVSLWILPVQDGRPNGPPELVREGAGRPLGFWQDGTLLLQNSGEPERDVYVAELGQTMTAAKPAELAGRRFIGSNVRPSWSRDGQYLAYFSFRGGGDNNARLQSAVIVIQTIATGQEREVAIDFPAAPADAPAPPRWFPDGRSVLVVSNDQRSPGHGYYKVDLETRKAELLHRSSSRGRGPNNPDLSADGKAIFYIDSDGETDLARLMRFDIAARRETEVKHAAGGESFTSIAASPDGSRLAYMASDDRARSTALFVMPVSGGEAREVFQAAPWTGNVRFGVLAWTPDGKHLVFVRPGGAGGQQLWTVPAAGGQARATGISRPTIKAPAVQPGGGRIAFAAMQPTTPEIWALENFLPGANGTK